MRAKTKTILKGFNYMQCDDFATLLMEMAAKGWHFKEWGVGLKFEKGEPEQAVYAVEVFQNASENDMRPEPNTEEFAEYCESAGWKFIDGKQKYCIFKKIDENAVDLFTPEERVTNAFKGTFSGSAWLMFFLYGLNAFLLWERLYHSFGNCIFSGGFWFSFSVWNVMFLGQLIIFLYAFLKKAKLMKEIRKGNQIYIGAKRDGKFHFDWNSIYIGLIVLILICYFFAMERMELVIINAITGIVTLGFAILLNKIRPDRDTSIGVQVVFSIVIMIFLSVSIIVTLSGEGEGQEVNIDNLPVRISDYRENDDVVRDFSYHYEGNIFGEAEKYFVYGEEDSLHYYVYKSSYPMILDKLWDDIIGGKKYNEGAVDCSEDWKVQKALRNKIGTYYVRFDNAILEFSDYEDSDLSTEQIAIILDKLDLR